MVMEVIDSWLLPLVLHCLSNPTLSAMLGYQDSTFQPVIHSNNQGQGTRMGGTCGTYSPEFMEKPEPLQRKGFGSWYPAHWKASSLDLCALGSSGQLSPSQRQGPAFCFPGRGEVTMPILENIYQIWHGKVNNYLLST